MAEQAGNRTVRPDGAAPTISIVIPVYNTARYLERCLDSVLSQTFSDIEVICVDDGSSDGSAAILDARARIDGRLRVVHRSNAGAAASRNVGLDMARGEYVLFVDSDDYIELHSCETLLGAAREADADIVVFGGRTFPSIEWIDRCLSPRDIVHAGDPFHALLDENGSYPLMCNKFYRRALLEDNGMRFNESLVLGEDNAFQFLVFPHAKTVAYTSACLYHYRCEREGSAIASHYGDLKGKVEKHFAVVSFVAKEWKRRSFIAGHKARFVDLILFFLFDDVKNLSFADRAQIGERLAELFVECGLAMTDCSPAMAPIASFMACDSAALSAPDRDVAVTVFLRLLDQPDDAAKKGFLHLANQSEQRLEFIVVDEDDARRAACIDLLGFDARIASAKSVEEGLALARGRYAIFADFNDEYEWNALREALDAVDEEQVDADVVVMRDVLGNLRATDVFRQVVVIGTREEGAVEGPAAHFAFHLSDLDDLRLSFSSLDACNKLWSVGFLKRASCGGWSASQVARGLLRADIAVACRNPLCEKKAGCVEACDDMARALDELAVVRDRFELEKDGAASCAQANGLVLSTGMRIVESSSTLHGARAAVELLLPYVRSRNVLANLPDSLYAAEDDYKAVLALSEAESLDEALFAHLIGLKRRDGGYIQALEARLEEREEELACVYRSLSFKVGRKITLLPRKLRDAVSRR
ncbi:MAG: glycosyltransferase family 2 protein [Slackia piriformis]|uniref:Glycosyltransferase family 2 protein n=1 Tax=Slackia piriformis TaxID=626934 RepID=A0A943YZ48_9ACTN|nr:glycosyltransferase family 2 protein [Slackia piriformis]